MVDIDKIIEKALFKHEVKMALKAINEKWITIHPHGEDSDDYRRLKIEDGETIKEAIDRTFGKEKSKEAETVESLTKKRIQMWKDLMKKYEGDIKKIPSEEKKKYQELSDKIKSLKENKDIKKDNKEIKQENKKNKMFEKYQTLYQDAQKAQEEWHNATVESKKELENDKKYQELNKKREELTKQIMNTSFVNDKDTYLELQKEKNKIWEQLNNIREDVSKKYNLKGMQDSYYNKKEKYQQEQKKLISENSKTIKERLKNISSRNDNLINNIEKSIGKEYTQNLNRADELKDLAERHYRAMYYSKNIEYNSEQFNILKDERYKFLDERHELLKKIREQEKNVILKVRDALKSDNGIEINATAKNENYNENTKRLKEYLKGIIPSTNSNNTNITISSLNGSRASCGSNVMHVSKEEKSTTLIHEYMHHLEDINPEILTNSLTFLTARTEGEKQKSLRKITGESYKADEHCKTDNFFHPYCGKIYDAFGGRKKEYINANASELMSMGVPRLMTDPIRFSKEDREYFDFVVANLKGNLWD